VRTSTIEKQLFNDGFTHIAGIDEAGRGPLAGPVFAAAVILPKNTSIRKLNDSKILTPSIRESLYKTLLRNNISIGIGIATPSEIDKLNILNATFLAMKRAVGNLLVMPDYLLIDGNKTIPGINIKQKAIVKGDSKCVCISAASIIAKVSRDKYMEEIHKKYSKYGFNQHKGYGTKEHFFAIKNFGICPEHRKTFLKKFVQSDFQTSLFNL